MDERELLILGLLMSQSQHGYQLNDFIERNLGRVTDMKKATAYAILKRLDAAGYVEVKLEQEGNRPPRQVYAITPAGETAFGELLRTSLSEANPAVPHGSIGLMFLDHLPPDEQLDCLERKLAKLDELVRLTELAPRHGHGIGVDLSIDHRVSLLRCERDWLRGVIMRIRGQA